MSRVTSLERRGSVHYFRRRVPSDLVAVVGRAVIKESLRERDPTRARLLHAKSAALWEERFAAMRRDLALAAQPLRSELSVEELAALRDSHRHVMLRQDEQIRLYGLSGSEQGLPEEQFERHGEMIDHVEAFAREDLARGRVASYGWRPLIDGALRELGLRVDPESAAYRRAGLEVLTATIEAMREARRRQGGEPVRTPVPPAAPEPPAILVTVDELVAGWSRETQPRAKTIYVFEKHLREFAAFAGGDLAKADADIAAAWKRSLLERKTPKTTYNHLASCKAVLNWAEENRLIRHNPFDKVKLPKLKSVTKRRSYTDEETVLILAAAREETGWKRWLPWLLVFTGGRITEICQLERADIAFEDGVWFINITDQVDADEARGTKAVKNVGSRRAVPIHRALIAEGFLDFVSQQQGLLFPEIKPDRFGSRGGNPSKVFGRWIRELLQTADPLLAPAHSFRHRFKTVCRRAGISSEDHDALTGHTSPGVGGRYGEPIDLPVRAAAIDRIPLPSGLFFRTKPTRRLIR